MLGSHSLQNQKWPRPLYFGPLLKAKGSLAMTIMLGKVEDRGQPNINSISEALDFGLQDLSNDTTFWKLFFQRVGINQKKVEGADTQIHFFF